MQIAVTGDYCEEYVTRRAMLPALRHAGGEGVWVPAAEPEGGLSTAGGISAEPDLPKLHGGERVRFVWPPSPAC